MEIPFKLKLLVTKYYDVLSKSKHDKQCCFTWIVQFKASKKSISIEVVLTYNTTLF